MIRNKKKELNENITDGFMRKRQANILKHQAVKKVGKIFYAIMAVVLVAVMAIVLLYVFYRLDIVELRSAETEPTIIEKPEEEFTPRTQTETETETLIRTY